MWVEISLVSQLQQLQQFLLVKYYLRLTTAYVQFGPF